MDYLMGSRYISSIDENRTMPDDPQDLLDAEPFNFMKRTNETDGAFVRFEYTLHPAPDAPSSAPECAHPRWLIDVEDEHIHPRQEEFFAVRSGKLRVAFADTERTLTKGEEITLPAGVPHRHGNPAERPARIVCEHRPALQSEPITEALFESAQAGHAAENGRPNLLHFAAIQSEYPGHAYRADLPIPIQKALFTLLAPIGRLAGHKAPTPAGKM